MKKIKTYLNPWTQEISRNKQFIIYLLLNDALNWGLLFFAITLLVENIIPGFISSKISFLKISILIPFLVIIATFFGKRLKLQFAKKISFSLGLLVITYFIANISLSLYRFKKIDLFIISFVSTIILLFLYKSFVKIENSN